MSENQSVNVLKEENLYPLTSYQRDIWIQQCLYPNRQLYNIGANFVIEGSIDYDIFQKAINILIKGNDALRINIIKKDDQYYQKIQPELNYHVDFHDFSKAKDPIKESLEWIENETIKLFDMYNNFLFKFSLLKVNENLFYWLMIQHHVITDGWGCYIAMSKVVDIYNRLIDEDNLRDVILEGNINEQKSNSYINFIRDNIDYLKSEKYKKDADFWKEYFKEVPQPFINRSAKKIQGTITSSRKKLIVKWDVYEKIVEYSKKNGCSTFHYMLGILYMCFSKIYDKNELVIGIPILNRKNAEQKNMLGLFVNLIPLKISSDKNESFDSILNKIKKELLRCYRHQKFPLGEIFKLANSDSENKRNIFDITLSYEKFDFYKRFAGHKTVTHALMNKSEENALAMFVREYADGEDVEIDFDYRFDVFDSNFPIENVMSYFKILLESVVNYPCNAISQFEILRDEEKQKILYDFNDTKANYSRNKTMHQLFEEQVEKTPDNLAAVFEGKEITYRELNERANQLAVFLKKKEINTGTPVAIIVERSMEMLIGVMGILKCGGAYVPIDPKFPITRIKTIIKNSNISCIVTQGEQIELIKELQKENNDIKSVICIDIQEDENFENENIVTAKELVNLPKENLGELSTSEDIAYIIYTSGSTGTPKGVVIKHKPAINLIEWVNKKFNVGEKDQVLFVTSFCFDLSVYDMFGILAAGGSIRIASKDEVKDSQKLLNIICEEPITFWDSAPAALQQLVPLLPKDKEVVKNGKLRLIFQSGDWIPVTLPGIMKKAFPGVKVISFGGATEATIWSNYYEIEKVDPNWISIPYGKPIQNAKYYILDSNLNPCPMGVAGDLYIGGECLAEGYANDLKQTEERFIPNPFVQECNEKMYKTGDMARWMQDGNMEFLGRKDHQVKIRGYRIEIGEIEYQLLQHESIKEVFVMAREDESKNKYLCTYIVAEDELTVAELRQYLSHLLPAYMIPSYFIQIPNMPITSNGKIDRKALPMPDGSLNTGKVYEEPTNEIEEKLVHIWRKVLGINKLGINDNFFDLGGDSLNAVRIIAAINKELNVEISLRDMFDFSEIKTLSKQIQQKNKTEFKLIDAIEEKDYYELSSAQKRLFVIKQFQDTSINYNMPSVTIIEGKLDTEKFENVFKELIKRHESLRTSFEIIDGIPMQKIYKEIDFKMEFIEKDEKELESIIKQFLKPFVLNEPPLLRVTLVKLKEERYAMLLDIHHIVSDGVSMEILLKEIGYLYEGKKLDELKIQYKDFSEWQKKFFTTEAAKKQEAYWLKEFSGKIPVLNMPTDYQRPSEQSFEGDKIKFRLDKTVTDKLKEIAAKTDATLYMTIVAAYNVLLSKYTGQEDIIVGSPVAGRTHESFQNIVGMFVNTIALRNFPKSDKKFIEFLTEVKKKFLESYENQDYQFEELIVRLDVEKDFSRNPLFDTMVAWQNVDIREADISGLSFVPYDFNSSIAKFDLTLLVYESKEGLECTFEYCTKLFKKETIEKFAASFGKVLTQIVENSKATILQIEIVEESEKKKLLYDFNDTKANYSRNKTMHQLFEEQVEKTPDNLAAVFEGKEITYRELNERANQLAVFLKEKGINAGMPVAIIVERSMEMIIGVMGILKCGGAYVPIDPKFPITRIKTIIKNSNISCIVTQGEQIELIKELQKENNDIKSVICIDIEEDENFENENIVTAKELVNLPKENLGELSTSEDIAYIIYTSGSTGTPKGVVIKHKPAINLIEWVNKKFNVGEKDQVLFVTSFCFDLSVYDMFGILAAGGCIRIASKDEVKDSQKLLNIICEEPITFWDSAPAALQQLVPLLPKDKEVVKNGKLRLIFQSGDWIPVTLPGIMEKAFPGVKVISLGGATEATIWSNYYEIEKVDANWISIPYGKPIQNAKYYILDSNLNPCPMGVAGDLYIGGECLAEGYANDLKQTEERFIPNAFVQECNEKMYKTGDMARWMQDGNMEFLGRKDHQVKIRGYRIEIGEIEYQLLQHESIKEVFVMAREDESKNKYLCAYIVAEENLTVAELRKYLGNLLPSYMIPSYLIQIPNMPITSNGKIDRKALPMTDGRLNTGTNYEEPTNQIEEKLAGIWNEILGISKIGINDNFFDLGGDSIKAIQIVSRMNAINLKIEIKDLLKNPTIKDLSKKVRVSTKQIEQGAVSGQVPLTPIQKWYLEQKTEDINYFNQAVMLYKKDGFDSNIVKKVFKKILEHHDSLRMRYKKDENGILQYCNPIEEIEITITERDFRYNLDFEQEIEEETNKIHRSLNLSDGPLFGLAIFKTFEREYLLIVIHHMVVDGISWRILLEDLASGYKQELSNKEIQFPKKTDSYKEWGEKLELYANTKNALKEIDYWGAIENTQVESLPKDKIIDKNMVADSKVVHVTLSEQKTEQLLRDVNKAYNTEVNDILITALCLTVKNWTDKDNVIINLEGHGREEIIEDIDITRTVGWFTSMYPVIFDMSKSEEISYQIKNIKETLRNVPNKGIGYGILKYLTDGSSKKGIEFNKKAEICFNYLGQFDIQEDTEMFSISSLSTGESISEKLEKEFAIEINGKVLEGKLALDINYNKNEYYEETINTFAENYIRNLENILDHCVDKDTVELTPSDFGDEDILSIEELDNINSLFN
ncbi:non-ribosomal peptide synthetase [Clostridium saccharobutylicum]|uniref:non-ribosomal peptide synthetase n=1 Tax=Clostridium saccharobutylicum TaxID=169679 RepID=UPI0015713A4D|nr:non-ribosomal peptide synthetase [Clostridium saccharobutylicum]NSB66306.1 amino acid adenylation domain-containing protein/non-ribosomal peptide synthase protein (TIGR01720 family) [Clostridium saccharobutylicum]